jgi:hypothetical protein
MSTPLPAFFFSFVIGVASGKVCISVLPKHQRRGRFANAEF